MHGLQGYKHHGGYWDKTTCYLSLVVELWWYDIGRFARLFRMVGVLAFLL